jgi:large subunit ribosomal protein L4
MVRGSTIKTRNQKGGGRSRQGSIRAPHHRHGGIVFGPVQRSYHQDLPKRVRRLAIRSALSSKVEDGSLKIIEAFDVDAPKTRTVVDVLKTFGMERSALIVTGQPARNLLLSTRNIPGAKTLPAPYLNVVDLLKARGVLMTLDAVREAEARWGGDRATRRLAPIPTEAARG